MDTFQTDDILLSSFLLTKNINLLEVVKDQPQHFVFVFADNNKCLELKRDFLNNAQAPAKELFFHRETLISEVKHKSFSSRKGLDHYE